MYENCKLVEWNDGHLVEGGDLQSVTFLQGENSVCLECSVRMSNSKNYTTVASVLLVLNRFSFVLITWELIMKHSKVKNSR